MLFLIEFLNPYGRQSVPRRNINMVRPLHLHEIVHGVIRPMVPAHGLNLLLHLPRAVYMVPAANNPNRPRHPIQRLHARWRARRVLRHLQKCETWKVPSWGISDASIARFVGSARWASTITATGCRPASAIRIGNSMFWRCSTPHPPSWTISCSACLWSMNPTQNSTTATIRDWRICSSSSSSSSNYSSSCWPTSGESFRMLWELRKRGAIKSTKMCPWRIVKVELIIFMRCLGRNLECGSCLSIPAMWPWLMAIPGGRWNDPNVIKVCWYSAAVWISVFQFWKYVKNRNILV